MQMIEVVLYYKTDEDFFQIKEVCIAARLVILQNQKAAFNEKKLIGHNTIQSICNPVLITKK